MWEGGGAEEIEIISHAWAGSCTFCLEVKGRKGLLFIPSPLPFPKETFLVPTPLNSAAVALKIKQQKKSDFPTLVQLDF